MPKLPKAIKAPFANGLKRMKKLRKKKSSSSSYVTTEEISINNKKEKVLAWSPEDIIDGMNGLTIPDSMSGYAVLIEVGGVDKGWKIDCMDMESNKIIVTRYNIPPSTSNKPSGPPTNDPSLQSLPWCWYKDRKLFSRIEEGKTSDMVAYMTGKIALSGDSSKFDGLDSCWKEAKENAKERKTFAIENGNLIEEEEDVEEEEDEFGGDEEAKIIATYKPEVEPKDPFTQAFWRRHFGTDALVAAYLFLLSSIGYMGIAVYAVVVYSPVASSSSVKELSDFAHNLGQVIAAILFLIGSVYFIELSYPETTMIMAYRAMTADLEKMSFWERYFTANELLIFLWLVALGLVLPFFIVSFYELFFLNAPLLALQDCAVGLFGTLASGFLNIMAMPDFMRMNNGNGSSYFYDFVCSSLCCLKGGKNSKSRAAYWKKHLGSDMLVGGWLFVVFGTIGTISVIPLVILEPKSVYAWLMFVTTFPFGLGSLLFMRASYPETMNSSIFFPGQENTDSGPNTVSSPLLP